MEIDDLRLKILPSAIPMERGSLPDDKFGYLNNVGVVLAKHTRGGDSFYRLEGDSDKDSLAKEILDPLSDLSDADAYFWYANSIIHY